MRNIFRRPIVTALMILCISIAIYLKREAFIQITAVFILSAAFTLLLFPICNKLEKAGWNKKVCPAVAVVGFILLAVLILAAFIPYLISHTVEICRQITPSILYMVQRGEEILSSFGIQIGDIGSLEKPAEVISKIVAQGTSFIAQGSLSFFAQIGRIVFALVIAYYLLCERESLSRHLLLILPISWRNDVLFIISGSKNALLSYLSGIIKTSLFVFVATLMGLLLLGIRDALILSIFMGIFEILPYIGPILASIPILLTAMSQGTVKMLFALGVVIIVQQVEGNFITPYFTASSTSIKPLSAIVSVFVLGSLMGIWGIILAIPLVVLLRSVIWGFRLKQIRMNKNVETCT